MTEKSISRRWARRAAVQPRRTSRVGGRVAVSAGGRKHWWTPIVAGYGAATTRLITAWLAFSASETMTPQTVVKLMMFAQALIPQHCRHKIFNASWDIGRQKTAEIPVRDAL